MNSNCATNSSPWKKQREALNADFDDATFRPAPSIAAEARF